VTGGLVRRNTEQLSQVTDEYLRAPFNDLLAPVCGWFTEGFDTRDLMDAKALLDELARQNSEATA
jgi:predicted ATPase